MSKYVWREGDLVNSIGSGLHTGCMYRIYTLHDMLHIKFINENVKEDTTREPLVLQGRFQPRNQCALLIYQN